MPQTDISILTVIEQFNRFFLGKAEVTINGNQLEITIDGATLIVSLPEVIGAQPTGR